ncbi:uncharacterized protein LOC135503083 [Lineus longissimus]|uniref:uncharacterized protein LOC135503083 n=1 Tax=Lineus longissimus TaxID=88925 RepID=UPI00315D3EE7
MEVEPADTEVDYSIIRDPIFTSVRSLDDYVNVMSIGTPEIKRIISEECDVILECKVCQSLFRSLPNLVSHKRVYCKTKFAGYMPPVPSHITEDETVVLEPTDPDEDGEKDQESKVMRPVYESVLDGSFEGASMGYKVLTDALLKEQSLAEDKATTVVELDTIPGNSNAMFQSVETYQGKAPSDAELKNIAKNKKRKREAELEGEGSKNKIVKVVPQAATHSHVKFSLRNRKATDTESEDVVKKTPGRRSSCYEWKKHVNVKSVSCNICSQKYSCLKTLRFHVETIHQEKRRFYPCPFCKALFSQVWGTRRHVERRHNKSYEQWTRISDEVKESSFLVPVDELDENGRPKNYELATQKKRTMALGMATKSKVRAVATIKRAAEKKSAAKLSTTMDSDTGSVSGSASNDDDDDDDETLSNEDSPKPQTVYRKPGEVKTPTTFSAVPGKILKVKVSPIKLDGKDVKSADGKGGSKDGRDEIRKRKRTLSHDTGLTTTASGKKVYKCYNCGALYDIKGSLNKHINRGRCFKKGTSAAVKAKVKILDTNKAQVKVEKDEKSSDRTPEKAEKSDKSDKAAKDAAAAKREALASVLSPKQLRKVNSLMDRDNIKCLQCKKQFTALILLSRHVIRHLGIVRYKCKFCLYKSFNQGECMKHVRNSHKKNDAHKFVMNIDKDSDDTKSDASCRGLSAENAKFSGTRNSAGVLKTIKQKSPVTSGASSSEAPTSPGVSPAFNLHVAKRLFAGATKSGDEAETKVVMVKDEPPSPTGSRSGSRTRSSSVGSTNSAGIDSTNIVDPNSKNYNISTRNSPRLFDTKPYKRVDGFGSLTTRHGTYEKKDGAEGSADENSGKKGKDGYTTIKNAGNKTPPRDNKTAEQIKKEKDHSTEKLIEEIFG